MGRPRIRTLKPEFFEDEKVNAVSRDARYLTIGLITRADDRGRQQNMEQAILGHVYPTGDVSVKHLQRWLAEVVGVGIAWAYDKPPFSYLWLPNFWRHQKINRPSESALPAHPEDPYRELPISDAIKAYRKEHNMDQRTEGFTESLSEQLTPPRAGARSVPFPSLSKDNDQGGEVDARTLITQACAILDAIPTWEPNEMGVENAHGMYPTVDLLQGCRLAVTWASDPSWEMASYSATLRAALRKLHTESTEGKSEETASKAPKQPLNHLLRSA